MKIRLHGTMDEIERATEKIRAGFQIVSISSPYKDRRESKLYRVYIEVRE